MFSVTKTKKYWFTISGALVLTSIIMLFSWGLNFGIDFTGGSLTEISYEASPSSEESIRQIFTDNGFSNIVLQKTDKGAIIRFSEASEEVHQKIKGNLAGSLGESFEEVRFESIGPSIGQELIQKSYKAIFIVLALIVLYVAWVFRKVSRPVASWKYGIAAIVALFHDVIITAGLFSFLGKFYGVEVDAPFIAAILTVLGYSVNDTIVVFDRIRENLHKGHSLFEETVDESVRQTFARSLNTSLTVILSLLAVYLFGGESVRAFSLALIVGVIVGTYSSIFLASPLVTLWQKQ